MKVIHRKTGNQYEILDVVVNTTNESDPKKSAMILYSDDAGMRFVREAYEFLEKFEIPDTNVLKSTIDYANSSTAAFEALKSLAETYVDTLMTIPAKEDHTCNCKGDCECHNEKPLKQWIKPINSAEYSSYRYIGKKTHCIPVHVVKRVAMSVLEEVFQFYCHKFEVQQLDYDNATSEYFLVGSVPDKEMRQVVQITKECYEELIKETEIERVFS